jgi:hypothetical protein
MYQSTCPYPACALIPGLPPQGPDLVRFESLFSDTLLTSPSETPLLLLLSMTTSELPETRQTHTWHQEGCADSASSILHDPLLFKSTGASAWGIALFKLTP